MSIDSPWYDIEAIISDWEIDEYEWEDIEKQKDKILSGISWNLEISFLETYKNVDNKFNKDKDYIHNITDNQLSILKKVIKETNNNFEKREDEELIINDLRNQNKKDWYDFTITDEGVWIKF